jgi:hypothetical protein
MGQQSRLDPWLPFKEFEWIMDNQEAEYERRATEYEEKAKRVSDPWMREKYLTLAKRCRETKWVAHTREGLES